MTTSKLLLKIAKIHPYKIPAIDASNGCYKIETSANGKDFFAISHSIDDILFRYWEFLKESRQIEIPAFPRKKAELVYSTRKSVV